MAKIDFMKSGIAVGVGVADELVERNDNAKGRVGFKRYSSILRTAEVVLGYGAQMMGMYADLGETLEVAATPLFVKTLANEFMPVGGAAKKSRMIVGAGASDWSPQYANPGQTSYRT